MDLEFTVRGVFRGSELTIRWLNGLFELIEGDDSKYQDLLSLLEETALAFKNVNFTAMVIGTDYQPAHMSCPLRLLHLLAYKTIIPPLLRKAKILSCDLIDESMYPPGAKFDRN